VERLVVEGDSQLIVRHINGQYRCREESLKKFFNAVKEEAKLFVYFEIRHIPREQNKRADWLANHAMDVSAPHCLYGRSSGLSVLTHFVFSSLSLA